MGSHVVAARLVKVSPKRFWSPRFQEYATYIPTKGAKEEIQGH